MEYEFVLFHPAYGGIFSGHCDDLQACVDALP